MAMYEKGHIARGVFLKKVNGSGLILFLKKRRAQYALFHTLSTRLVGGKMPLNFTETERNQLNNSTESKALTNVEIAAIRDHKAEVAALSERVARGLSWLRKNRQDVRSVACEPVQCEGCDEPLCQDRERLAHGKSVPAQEHWTAVSPLGEKMLGLYRAIEWAHVAGVKLGAALQLAETTQDDAQRAEYIGEVEKGYDRFWAALADLRAVEEGMGNG